MSDTPSSEDFMTAHIESLKGELAHAKQNVRAALGLKRIAEAERDAAVRDTKRYRWIRSQPMHDGHTLVTVELLEWDEDGPTGAWYSFDGTALDAAIDAAISAEGEKK